MWLTFVACVVPPSDTLLLMPVRLPLPCPPLSRDYFNRPKSPELGKVSAPGYKEHRAEKCPHLAAESV